MSCVRNTVPDSTQETEMLNLLAYIKFFLEKETERKHKRDSACFPCFMLKTNTSC